jgi:hypothetical protein
MKFVDVPANLAAYEMLEFVTRVTVTGNNALDRDCLNVWHFKRSNGILQADLGSLVVQMANWFSTIVLPAMNIGGVMGNTTVRPLDDPTVAELENTSGAGDVGGVTGDRYDSQSAVFVQLLTGTRGRNFRGSKHFTPLSESDTTLDELTGGGLANWGGVASNIGVPLAFTDGSGNQFNLAVLSQSLSVLSGPSITFTGGEVEGAVLNPVVGSMNRRRERRGT